MLVKPTRVTFRQLCFRPMDLLLTRKTATLNARIAAMPPAAQTHAGNLIEPVETKLAVVCICAMSFE